MTIAGFDYTFVTLTCSGKEVRCIMEKGVDEGECGRMQLVSDTEEGLPFREGDTIRLELGMNGRGYGGGEVVVDRLVMEKSRDWTRFTIEFHREW